MLALPKSLLHLGVNLLTLRTARQLRHPDNGVVAQEATFRVLVQSLARTAVGRELELKATASYDDFQQRIPIRTYSDLVPYIERMRRGESDVLWPGACQYFSTTAGSTGDQPKCLPVTNGLLAHFRRASLQSLLLYTARVGHVGVFRGRHLFLGSSTALEPLAEAKGHPSYLGGMSGIAALNLPRWAKKHLYEPGRTIASLPQWSERLQAMAKRALNRDISLIAGPPNRLLAFAHEALNQGTGTSGRPPHLNALWPNLECLVHGGAAMGYFAEELQKIVGPDVNFHEVYTATEAFVAVQTATQSTSATGLRLLTDTGVFYEFLPLTAYDESRFDTLRTKAVPLSRIRPDVDYVILATTPAGLCRYVLGDVVRFISIQPPQLIYQGRAQHQLNAFGEQIVEKEIADALIIICRRHDWMIANFHVAPIFLGTTTFGQPRGKHEWWIELKPGTKETPTGASMAIELDIELRCLSAAYATRRKNRLMDPPTVRLVMPGLFEHWRRETDRMEGAEKTPRCRSDREIADQLAEITRFSGD